MQGICGSNDSVMNSDLARAGKIAVLFQARLEADPRLKEVALGADGARNQEERQVLELFFMRAALGRPFVAPPGLPGERVELLRRAFDKTMADKAFIEEAGKQSFTVEPMTGEELAANLDRAYKMPPAIIKRTADVLGRVSGAEAKK